MDQTALLPVWVPKVPPLLLQVTEASLRRLTEAVNVAGALTERVVAPGETLTLTLAGFTRVRFAVPGRLGVSTGVAVRR